MKEKQSLLRRIMTLRDSTPSDDSVRLIVSLVKEHWSCDVDVAVELARSLAKSGSLLHISGSFVADIASTGGPSSLSTLISPLYLRACGAKVPKLGVPGRPAGGIDCLGQIPSYRSILSPEQVVTVLESGGYAHFLASRSLAPLDRRMFKVRQELGAQAVPTLVTASLLAKKIAVGVKYVGLDVRVASHGNFGANWEDARNNALLFRETARILGVTAVPVLTDAEFPYQPYFGRRESLFAVRQIFVGKPGAWLSRHQKMCETLALATVPPAYRGAIKKTTSAELEWHFYQNLRDQGAAPDAFEKLAEETVAGHIVNLTAHVDGFCCPSLRALRDALTGWQNSFMARDTPFPDPVGIVFLAEAGDWLEKGDPIATVRVTREIEKEVVDRLESLLCFPTQNVRAPGMELVNG